MIKTKKINQKQENGSGGKAMKATQLYEKGKLVIADICRFGNYIQKSHFFIIFFTKIINTDGKLEAIMRSMRKNAQRR